MSEIDAPTDVPHEEAGVEVVGAHLATGPSLAPDPEAFDHRPQLLARVRELGLRRAGLRPGRRAPRRLEFEGGDAPQRGTSGEEVWELFATVYGSTRTLAASLDADRGQQFHTAFVEFFEGYRANGEGIHQPRPYLIVHGKRR